METKFNSPASMPSSHILVTGGAGYIGSQMVLALLDAGQGPVVLDNMSTGVASAVPKGVPLYEGDCGNQQLVSEIIRSHAVRAIVHFAGSIVVPDSVVDPLGYYLNNTVNSRALIAAAVGAGIQTFIFSSTAAVYGEPTAVPISESAPLQPISPYGSSKLMTEIMLRDAARAHELRYVALRYFNVAGADSHNRTGQSSARATHLIKVACQAALGERPYLSVYGDDYPTADGTCERDYIHVADLAAAHMRALDYLSGGGESMAINCGYGRGYSVLEVIAAVKHVSGRDFEVRHESRRAGDPPSLVAAVNRVKDVLGWQPVFDDLNTIVAHALAWETRLRDIRQHRFARA